MNENENSKIMFGMTWKKKIKFILYGMRFKMKEIKKFIMILLNYPHNKIY